MAQDPAILVRRYRGADLDAVIAIFQRAVREAASRDYSPAQIAAWSRVDRDEWGPWRLSRPAWVAESDGVSCGFSDLEPDGHLDMMFVLPAFHRMGVASALLDAVEAHAHGIGLDRIHARASLTGRPFFERRGFTVVAPEIVENNGERFDVFRVEKILGRMGT